MLKNKFLSLKKLLEIFLIIKCFSNLGHFYPKQQVIERHSGGVQHEIVGAHHQKGNRLANHESYLMCPGKPAMKLDTNFPVSKFRVFYKNFHHEKSSSLTKPSNNQINYHPKHFIDIYHWIV